MKPLDLFPDECINLLHNNNLLQPLVRSVLVKDLLSEIKIETELKDKLVSKFMGELNISDENILNDWLDKNRLDRMTFEELALSKTKLKKYSKNQFNHKVEARFLERKTDLDIVVYSMIRVKDYFLAREIYFRIFEKESEFGELAKKHSDGIESKTRGIVGPAPLGQAHPRLIELLKCSNEGEVNTPIQIDDYYIIVRLEYYEDAKLDDYMRERMIEELFNKWIDEKANLKTNFLLDNQANQVQESYKS